MFRLFFFLFIFNVSTICGQHIDDDNFTRYTKLQGLSHNYISCIAQDTDGSIWIGTHKGLNSFDGKFFRSWFKQTEQCGLPDNLITSIRITPQRELIGSTLGGAFILDIRTLHQQHLIIPSDSSLYFWSNHVEDVIKDKAGNYIVSTKTGLFVFNKYGILKKRFDFYHKDDVGKKELLFGSWLHTLTNGNTVQKNEKGFWEYNPITDQILQLPYVNGVFTCNDLKQGQNNKYFIGKNDDLFIFNEVENIISIWNAASKKTTSAYLPGTPGSISGIYPYNDTLIAITYTTGGFGFFSYNASTGKCHANHKTYFLNKKCTYLFKDHENRLWVGTTDGLYKENLSNSFFESVLLTDENAGILYHDIKSVLVKGDNIYLGMDQYGGIVLLNKANKKIRRRIYITDKPDQLCNSIHYLFDYDKNTIWIGTTNGLYRMNVQNFSIEKIRVPITMKWMNTSAPNCFFEDSRHNIWISFGLPNSVVYYNRQSKKFVQISSETNPLLRTTKCWSLAEDWQGNIWLAGDGLCRWNTHKQKIDTLIPYPTVTSALRNYMLILDIDQDNNLWLSSFDNEIIQYNCTVNKMYLRKKESNLIDGNTVTSSPIINNTIWMGTDNGISAFNLQDYSIKQFTYADGLPTVVVTSYRKGSYYDASDDCFYIGARNHLISFKPDISQSLRKAPALLIDRVVVSDTLITDLSMPISLIHSQNDITINFKAINFNDPEDNRFAYRLVSDHASGWHETNGQGSVYLNNLAAGTYTVWIKLFSANNRWQDQIKKITFTIYPPFWKTWWFIFCLSLSFVLTVYLLYRVRIRNIRQKANLDKQVAELEMKALHAQMNPHFIFNSLNSIKDMILQNERSNASRYLSRFAQLVRLNLKHAQQSFVSLHQQIEYLKHYLDMEKLRFEDFSYSIIVDKDINPAAIKLIPMLLQPLAENAIWHGLLPQKSNKELTVRFKKNEHQLICEIEDNGIGINASLQTKKTSFTTHQSWGIKSIQQRLQVLNDKYKMNCSLEIEDITDLTHHHASGTLVILRLSLL